MDSGGHVTVMTAHLLVVPMDSLEHVLARHDLARRHPGTTQLQSYRLDTLCYSSAVARSRVLISWLLISISWGKVHVSTKTRASTGAGGLAGRRR